MATPPPTDTTSLDKTVGKREELLSDTAMTILTQLKELQNCLESQKRTIIHIEQDDALSDQQHESHMIIPRMKARLESRKGCGYFES
ncbi:uncharacterized protein BO96DRAFT_348037 [Aspergillus niger CBS 101883]|uniref:Contig An01c0060, genomic contig n=2 Tax=Aspergillus niger TaxID=5061 RepID=A2Q7M6_ASPNC|nr:uncharacterized protein BO96DRAFT_348037 [Aspergillus niger CBS 101883]XP_059599564.1 uncharacterized protein An01g01270 [Aspergillus niger]PYH52335.1 hypothetical protein BO96DRAFT_348037 [Aspergillus niger CBS 101883]CAK36852.1 unnamed protein product [Aspergillus niger]